MEKDGEKMNQVTIEFIWIHPENGCPGIKSAPTIRQRISASDFDLNSANRYAWVLAENSPQICSQCKEDYIFKGKA